MNAERELLRAYREWRRLAEAETKAIQTRNWHLLTDCHLAIKDFQVRVASLTQETQAEWQRAGFNWEEKTQALRALIADLMNLTRRNHDLLQQMLAIASNQLGQLGEAGKNLKRLRQSYGFNPGRNRAAA